MIKSWLRAAALFAALATASRSAAVTVSHSLDELLNKPVESIEFHPYDIGVMFDAITDITIELAGAGKQSKWELVYVGDGSVVSTHESSVWGVDLYEPPANHASQGFVGSGQFDVTLDLFKNGSWDEMERGAFSLRPELPLVYPAIYAARLVEGTAEVTLTKAILHFTGAGVTSIADANGDGMVDGYDFLEIQRRGATAQRIAAWRDAFGTATDGAALGVPEPAVLTLFAAGAAVVGARRGRKLQVKSLLS